MDMRLGGITDSCVSVAKCRGGWVSRLVLEGLGPLRRRQAACRREYRRCRFYIVWCEYKHHAAVDQGFTSTSILSHHLYVKDELKNGA